MKLNPNSVTATLLVIAAIFGVLACVISPGTAPVIFELPKEATALTNWKMHNAWSLAFEVSTLTMVAIAAVLKLRRKKARCLGCAQSTSTTICR